MASDLNSLKKRVEDLKKLGELDSDVKTAVELYSEDPDEGILAEAITSLETLDQLIRHCELSLFLSAPFDEGNAIMAIHPGQGGTEACDWADMLYRMYARWAEREGFQVRIMDTLAGEEAGIKSVTLSIMGDYAYGYLRGEMGVHRLVRISPFDAASRRHTSFASVDVFPEPEEEVDIEVLESDIDMEVFRSGGPGGQNVNKLNTAVRLRHQPSGIVVACQTERTQHANRESAMRILKAKLLEMRLREEEKKKEEARGMKKQIGWGSQIRSYVLAPYTTVKDHRTDCEAGNAQGVLDGDITPFIQAYLVMKEELTNN